MGALLVSSGTVAAPPDGLGAATERGERGDWWSVAASPDNTLIISDSAIAGVRWLGALGDLTNSRWIDRLESCRRLVSPSCRGREGYRPLTAADQVRAFVVESGRAGSADLLVMATGYNDWHGSFREDLERVLFEARVAGFRRVAWLTYREDVRYTLPGSGGTFASNYRLMNQILRETAASGRWPELRILDYDAATRPFRHWFASDGVHLTPTGAVGVARWLSSQVLYRNMPTLAPDNWLPPGS